MKGVRDVLAVLGLLLCAWVVLALYEAMGGIHLLGGH